MTVTNAYFLLAFLAGFFAGGVTYSFGTKLAPKVAAEETKLVAVETAVKAAL